MFHVRAIERTSKHKKLHKFENYRFFNVIKQWLFKLGPVVWHTLCCTARPPVSASPLPFFMAAYELLYPESKSDSTLTLKFVQYFNILPQLLGTKSPDLSFDSF